MKVKVTLASSWFRDSDHDFRQFKQKVEQWFAKVATNRLQHDDSLLLHLDVLLYIDRTQIG